MSAPLLDGPLLLAAAALGLALLLARPFGRVADRPAERLGRGRVGGATARRGRGAPAPSRLAVIAALAAAGAGLGGLTGLPPAGRLPVTAGLAASAATVVWWLQRGRPRTGPAAEIGLVLDVAAAVLRAGQTVPAALESAAGLAGPALATHLRQVSTLLRLGADPTEAWRETRVDPTLDRLARAAIRSAASGARLAEGWERLAVDLRAELRAAAATQAHRAGVWAMAPLGLCFLPAFLCLGVGPTVLGLAHSAFAGIGP